MVGWILQILLAVVFLGAGTVKLARPKSRLAGISGMSWVEDLSQNSVRIIAGLEVLGGLGLVLPALLGIARVFEPLSAFGLGIVMVGATVVHLRRKELPQAGLALVLLIICLIVMGARFNV